MTLCSSARLVLYWLRPPRDGQLAFGTDDGAEADALMVQARAILDLGEAFAGRLEEVGAADLLRDMELPTSALLARMERHGIAADRAHLEAMEQMFAGAVQQAVKEAHAAAGHEFNLGSPKQLQEVLFGELGLPKTKKTKTGYTTDADALAWLAAPDRQRTAGRSCCVTVSRRSSASRSRA